MTPVVELAVQLGAALHHLRRPTSPDSGYVRTLTVQRPYDDRSESLRARTFRTQGPGGDEREVLADAGAWATAAPCLVAHGTAVGPFRQLRPADGRQPTDRL